MANTDWRTRLREGVAAIGRPRAAYEIVERSLDAAALWTEVRDQVHKKSGASLSGGQQQIVGIARAVIHKPALLLADEPTGNLDSRTSVEIMQIFQDLNDSGLTIVLVTHEPDIAQFAKRTVVFRDGKIRHDDPVRQRPRAAEVLKNMPTVDD